MTLRELIGRFLGAPQTHASPVEAELRRILAAGDDARRAHRPDQAAAHYRKGLESARTAGLMPIVEVFLGQLGALYTDQGEYVLAERAFEEALRLADESGHLVRRARALLNFGAYHLKRGQLAEAQAALQTALDLSRKAGDVVTLTLALGNLADVYLHQKNPAYALRLLREAAPQSLQNSQHMTYLLGRMGQAHLALGEADRARRFLAQAIRLAEQYNQAELELMFSSTLADHLFEEHRLAEALSLYKRNTELADRVISMPEEYHPLPTLLNQATAYQRLHNPAEAVRLADRALEAARAADDLESQAAALAILGRAHQASGESGAALERLEQAVSLYNARRPESAERLRALLALGNLYQEQGKADRAHETYQSALETAGDDKALMGERAGALQQLGHLRYRERDLQGALDKWAEALALYEASGNHHAQAARLLCDMGGVRRVLAGINAALPDFEKATVLLNHAKDDGTRGYVLSNVANLYTDLGEVETARAFYEESLELARRANNKRAESLRLGNYGWLHLLTGKPKDAQSMIESALRISRELDDTMLIAVQQNNLAQAHHEQKDYPTAERLYRGALEMLQTHPDPSWSAILQSNLARALLAQNRVEEAIRLLEEAIPVSRAQHDHEAVSRGLARVAEAYRRQGRPTEADQAAREAESLARKYTYRKGQADALYVRAALAEDQKDEAGRLALLREAKRLYYILHDPLATEISRILGE